jgi:hypothetical protein
MSASIRLPHKRWSSVVIVVLWLPLLAACGDVEVKIGTPTPALAPCSNRTDVSVCKDLVFTSGRTERGRQRVDLGAAGQPGRYTLRLESANPSQSGHWLEWDYLALDADGKTMWQIGENEAPPDYSAQASDEFCKLITPANCQSAFEVAAGKVDPAAFPKTLNDGSNSAVYIEFIVTPEQAGSNLVLTLSTLYSTHTNPDVEGFRMQVTLRGPH